MTRDDFSNRGRYAVSTDRAHRIDGQSRIWDEYSNRYVTDSAGEVLTFPTAADAEQWLERQWQASHGISPDNPPHNALRHHVSGAIARGEAAPIVERPMRHIVSATVLTTGEQLAMCGHVFPSYSAAVEAGHKVGNYLGCQTTLAAYHARGVDCETCAVRHSQSGGRAGIAS